MHSPRHGKPKAQSPRILPEIILVIADPAEGFRSLSIRRKYPIISSERVKGKKTVFPFILVILQAACAFIADPAEEFRSPSIRRIYLTIPGERVKGEKPSSPLYSSYFKLHVRLLPTRQRNSV
ncbi:hypothetical protein Q6316_27250, partial [Klebsiella pneumoniae]